MRILHVNPTLGVIGGTEVYLSQLIAALRERGHVSEVAAERNVTNGTTAPFHQLFNVWDLNGRWTAEHSARLREIVRRVDPDLIHIHNTLSAELVAEAADLRATIRSVHDHTLFCPTLIKEYADGGLCDRVFGAHCVERHQGAGCLCLRLETRRALDERITATEHLIAAHHGLGRLVVASEYMRRELIRAGLPVEQITLAPPFTPARRTNSHPKASPPLVVAASRMVHPDKGIAVLLDALQLVEAPFQALLLGDGQDLPMLRERCSTLGLDDRVRFAGFEPHARTIDWIASAHVVAFPSMWNEPFGLVGIEAMAHGRPVVAFDVGGVRDWLDHDRTGILVRRGDAPAFARAITRLLRDRALADRFGAQAVLSAERRFSKRAHVDAVLNVYREVSARRRRRAATHRNLAVFDSWWRKFLVKKTSRPDAMSGCG